MDGATWTAFAQSEGLDKFLSHHQGANGIESACSLLISVGSWHKVSAKHLPAYLEEMTFRFNRRGRADLFIDTLRHMVTADPLTFEELTA